MSVLIGGKLTPAFRVVAASSYANLPASPLENTIGIITTVPIRKVYYGNEALTLVDGDVVLRTGVRSAVKVTLALPGTHTCQPSEAWQKQSGVLVRVDSYHYTAGAWNAIYISLYEVGSISPAAGDFLLYRFGGTGTTLTKNADHMYHYQPSSDNRAWTYSQNKVDLTPCKTVHFFCRDETGVTVSMGVATASNVSTAAASNTTNQTYDFADIPLDVTSLTGLHHIVFGHWASISSRYMRVRRIWIN